MNALFAKIPAWILDRTEQAAAVLFFGWLLFRLWPGAFAVEYTPAYLVMASEGLVLLFLLIRRPTQNVSLRIEDWLLAVSGTIFPMLIMPGDDPFLLPVGVSLMLVGFVVQFAAKVSLNRSFGLVAANRGVKRSGAYRYVRHPMYLGYVFSHVGYLIMVPSFWNLGVYALGWTCLVLRIRMEERVLSESEAYRDFKEQTPYRLIPFVY